jgi:hypothetical protein
MALVGEEREQSTLRRITRERTIANLTFRNKKGTGRGVTTTHQGCDVAVDDTKER